MTKIEGYKGIMELDLTNVPEKFHSEMVAIHLNDIKEYKIDQATDPKIVDMKILY